MFAPRFRKVIRDLSKSKGRTILVVLAIAVGVFAFGSVFITQELLLKNIDDSYNASRPSTITMNLSSFDESLVNWTRMQEGVLDAQGKSLQTVKLIKNDKEEILSLVALPDYKNMKLNLLIPKKGVFPPGKGEIALERNSFTYGKYTLGETLTIKDLQDREIELTLTSMVYDNSAIPYMFTKQLTGFISWETLTIFSFPKKYNQLEIATDTNIKTLDDAQKLTDRLTKILEDRGVTVSSTQVAKPNQHWATDNSKAFTAILSIIGTFSLFLSAFLVVNTISALLAQQKKQIGIMKAIGARQKQVTALYLLTVSIYGVLALLVALPIGMALGYFFLKLVTDFLNLDINSFYLPPSIFFMQLAAALFVPLIAAVIPIIQSAKKPIRVALSDYQTASKVTTTDTLLTKITSSSRILSLSLRNVFRKKVRLILTLGTLVVAGALFMAVINVRTGMYREIERILQMYDFQVDINLARDTNVESVIARIRQVPNVTEVEARTSVSGEVIKEDGTKGTQFRITGVPANTPFSHPVIYAGRWLKPSDNDAIVLSTAFIRDNTDVSVGDTLKVSIENEEYNLNVVGIIVMSAGGGGGGRIDTFSTFSTVSRIKDTPNLASGYLIRTQPSDVQTQDLVASLAEEKLKNSRLTIAFKQTKNDIISSASSQFNFMIFFLLAMAVMVASVGGLGLAGTMSLNVLERTREIGIMRSIGANDAIIRKIVLSEGVIVGVISFLIAIPLSLPLTYGLCYAIGNAFFDRTLVFAVVPIGMAIWLFIVLVIAITASLVPARNASKMSINETLSYE